MSFVHCSACHRAYDLRRSPGCPSCRQKAAAAEQAAAAQAAAEQAAAEQAAAAQAAAEQAASEQAAQRATEQAAAEQAAAEQAAAVQRAAEVERQRAAAPARLADEAELIEDAVVEVGPTASAAAEPLAAYRAAPREERIVAMVEELAALLEGASTGELEAAQRKLQQRGLRAPWTAQLSSGGRFLLAAGSQLVTSAIRAPQVGARKLARRLRDAWSGGPPRDDLRA